MKTLARNVFIDLIGRDRVSPAFAAAAASADRAAGKMSAANARMAKTGATLTRGVTVPLLAIAAVSTDVAIKYQKSMTLLQTAGGESAKKTAAISKGIQDVAIKTGTSLKDLTEGMYTVAKAGSRKWSAAGQLNVLKAAAEGAKAENVDLGTATNALTSVMMSYHMGASKAVQVQNQLVVGAGRAKTTMQDYAGALSTVIPVASAAHISFAQVAGAIATMTQHGTSADEATQELSHTIRNLLSPNQVAQKAMQQLGLSVVDVTKNLGKRGLTGTIDLITNAIAKHMGPAGMVAVSAFKQSQSAAADLRVELDHMPKSLQDISRQFSSGKMSYKDYYTAVKGLGGQQFQLGKDFIGTFKAASGFNDMLKSGSPVARTFAGTLKQVLGTATSMNTALQLGGENAAYFKTATDDVAAAARKSGSDVLGWAKTSQTLQVKMDKAKASIQVLALEIGNALIPAVTKIVEWVRKAVDWFTHLSGTQKAILGWSLAFVAALGPILTITARLGTVARGIGLFVGGVSTRLATLAGATEVQATRISLAMRGITSAMLGVGIGLAIGNFTKNASTGAKWLGVLGSAGAGAAIGFSVGGPLGAGVGALAGAVSDLAVAFTSTGSSAQTASKNAAAALQAQKQAAGDLYSALQSVNGEYNKTYKAAAIQELQKPQHAGSKMTPLDEAQAAGINPQKAVEAVLGSQSALSTIIKAYNHTKDQLNAWMAAGTYDLSKPYQAKVQQRSSALNNLIQDLGNLSPAAADAARKWIQAKEAQTGAFVSSKMLAGGLKTLSKEFQTSNRSLVVGTAYYKSNSAVIKANLQHYQDLAEKQFNAGRSAKSVAAAYRTNTAALENQLVKLGFNKEAVDNLIASEGKLPRNIKQVLDANSTKLQSKIAAAQDKLNNIRQGKVPELQVGTALWAVALAKAQDALDALRARAIIPIQIVASTVTSTAAGRRVRATGGWVFGPGTATSDSIPVRVSNGEFVVRASQARKYAGLLNRINTPGFASGGKVDTSKIGSAIGTIGQAYVKPIDVASVGITLIRKQIQNALDALNQQIANGLSKASAASFRKEITSLTDEANAQLADLRLKIKGSDLAAFKKSLTDTATDSYSVVKTLLSDVYRAGGATKVLDQIRGKESKLLDLEKQRNAVNKQIVALQQKWNDTFQSVKAATLGSFDITTAGVAQTFNDRPATSSIGGILTSVRLSLANARKFASVLHQLAKKGLNKVLVMQLASAGPAALAQAQALLAATPDQLKSVNWNYAKLTQASKYIGSVAADAMYNVGAAQGQGLLDGLKSKASALNKQIKHIGVEMIRTLKTTLGIKSPSTVMRGLAHHTADGYRLGLVDRIDDVRRAGKDLGNAATPADQMAGWKRTETRGGHTFHIYETHDAGATAMAVLRRERMAGYGAA